MEEEELNEEMLGDPDEMRVVDGKIIEAGEGATSEEPAGDASASLKEVEHMHELAESLIKRVEALETSISTLVEAGATVIEPGVHADMQEEDKEEPFLYLEDMDFNIRKQV